MIGHVAEQRVRVVGRRVDDLVHAVVLEPVRIARRSLERPEEDDHAREAECVAEPLDVLRDHAEILGDHGQLAELGLRRPEDRLAGAGKPAAGASVELVRPSGIAQKAAKPRK